MLRGHRLLSLASALFGLCIASGATIAQAPGVDTVPYKPTLTFDVASVRETQQPEDSPGWRVHLTNPPHACEFEANGILPKVLIQYAYGFGPFQIANGPDWLMSSFYNVRATCDHSVDEQLAKLSDADARLEKQHMMQQLLAERFGLKMHWETRQAQAFAMTQAKGGAKLQAVDTPVPTQHDATPDTPGADVQSTASSQGRVLVASRISSKGIAGLFATMLNMPVLDQTGLPGIYNLTLRYNRVSDANESDSYPTLFTAMREELGLRLEPAKGDVQFLVIDHMERPSAN
jgi:uncharacterized protein (TIGR03435 family)